MKKFLYILMLLPFMLGACSDDKDFPSVDITIAMSGAAQQDGVVYAVQGTPFNIDAITVRSLNGNAAALTTVAYYWNNVLSSINPVSPYAVSWNTQMLPVGDNVLQLQTSLLEVDKSIVTALLTVPVRVVASEEDLPEGLTLGSVSQTITVNPE